MKTVKKFLPSTADLRPPSFLIGRQLDGVEKNHYQNIQRTIDEFMMESGVASNRGLLSVLDAIEDTKKLGTSRSMEILTEIVKLIRIQLLSNDPIKVHTTVVLIDGLIKNSGYRIHVLIGRRRFMKTYGLVLRRHRAHTNSPLHQRVSALMIDCIQAYGEAFASRRLLYPSIFDTYYKTRNKYGIRFPRPDHDPTRVPIFLGEITAQEKQLAMEYPEPDQQGDYSPPASPRDSSYTDTIEIEEVKDSYEQQQTRGQDGSRYYSQSKSSNTATAQQQQQQQQRRQAGGGGAGAASRGRGGGQQRVATKELSFAIHDWETDDTNAVSKGKKGKRGGGGGGASGVATRPVEKLEPKKSAQTTWQEYSDPDQVDLIDLSPLPEVTGQASFKAPVYAPPPVPSTLSPPPVPYATSPPLYSAVSPPPLLHAPYSYQPAPAMSFPQAPPAPVPLLVPTLALVPTNRPPPPPPVLNPRVLATSEVNARKAAVEVNPFEDLAKTVERMKTEAITAAITNGESASMATKSMRRARSEAQCGVQLESESHDSFMAPLRVPVERPDFSVPAQVDELPVKLRPVSLRRQDTLSPLVEVSSEAEMDSANASGASSAVGTPSKQQQQLPRTGTYYLKQQELKRRASTGTMVSSDPTVEVKFYGPQRVVQKRPEYQG